MRLSDFGLCSPLDYSNFSDLNENDVMPTKIESLHADGRLHSMPKRSQQEHLEHWQKNRRTLVSNYNDIPTIICNCIIVV
jgi:serine/threonine kinase 38